MQGNTEADNFRRIELNSDVERAVYLIGQYREGIDFYRRRMNDYYRELGRIAERLGEPKRRGPPNADR
jgi:hypothetical protein